MTFYKNTAQISETCDYKFELPKYGKSTTDPTFFEPTATRIANMKKSASSMEVFYDFKDDKIEISSARITPGRKPGMTREEISQRLNDTQSDLLKFADDKKTEKEALLKNIEDTKAIKDALSKSEATEKPAGE